MWSPFQFFRIRKDVGRKHFKEMQNVIQQSQELLANSPMPDTFLGRQTQEPFPEEAGWLASKELQPPK